MLKFFKPLVIIPNESDVNKNEYTIVLRILLVFAYIKVLHMKEIYIIIKDIGISEIKLAETTISKIMN